MNRKHRLKIFFVGIVLFWALLAGYKGYLYFFERDYSGLNALNLDRILASVGGREEYSFAVMGNFRNSMKIFDKRIAPLLHGERVDFIISAGNSVYDGAEDKYRMLSRGLNRTGFPYLLAVGANEVEDRGTERFYRHFGPLFFSLDAGGSHFIFLDTTGETSWSWQMRWLEKELAMSRDARFRFVIMNRSIHQPSGTRVDGPIRVLDRGIGDRLREMFSKYEVNAVFSSGYQTYDRRTSGGVEYFNSGCGGGLLLSDKKEGYQYLRVDISVNGAVYSNVRVPHKSGPFMYKLETLGFFLHSFFYISFFNFLLVLGFVGMFALKVYSMIVRQETLYRDFSVDENTQEVGALRVAMFTNNYLPFVGGVPISIHRLYQGLVDRGNVVRIFAPSYGIEDGGEEDEGIWRCPTFTRGGAGRFQVANIFSKRIREELDEYKPDLVHVHHPFWLGWKGKMLARKAGVPVVFTYHTRLERYMHYVPIPWTDLKEIVAHQIIRRFANGCDGIIAPSSSTEEYLRRLGVHSLVDTIPTGINIREYERWSSRRIMDYRARYAAEDEPLLLSISRLASEKNLDFLVDGLLKVRAQTKVPFRCILVGDGPERERLEEKVNQLGMGGCILFTGSLEPSEVAGACLAADLFVFASTSETQGMVLLEAMAGGCPVVAVSSSGVYDVVENGFNGFKVPESTDSWAKAVVLLLEQPELRGTLSRNSKEFAEKYSEANISERVLNLYRRILGLKRSGSREVV